jgi:hypothetical protein
MQPFQHLHGKKRGCDIDGKIPYTQKKSEDGESSFFEKVL